MKKNKMMRLASILLVCVLLTTSVIGGTFAKYVTSATSNTSARVANWGFKENTIDITDLFATAYDDTVASANGTDKVIAPGTEGKTEISFVPSEGVPEVDYKITVTATSTAAAGNTIVANPTIEWALYKKGTAEDAITWGRFDDLLEAIEGLSQTKVDANNAPTLNDTYVIAWHWLINESSDATNAQNVTDTTMGNANPLETIDLTITILAEQID